MRPKVGDWVVVYYEGDWTPFLVFGSSYDDDGVYVHGWLFRPGHDGSQWHGNSRVWEGGGIPNKDPGDLGELHWKPNAPK